MSVLNTTSLVTIFVFVAFHVSATPPHQLKAPVATLAGNNLLGHYKYSSGSERNDIWLSVTISREAGELTFELLAGHPDAHGAAPDGGGTGTIGPDGAFRFSYADGFLNKGTGTFKRTARGYALSIHIDEVRDSRCMPFYGDFILQRSKRK
jgi:hypothetical protein